MRQVRDGDRGRLPADRHRRELPQRGGRRRGPARLRRRPLGDLPDEQAQPASGTASTASGGRWRPASSGWATDYLDLFLIHWPNPDQDRYVDAVRGLEALREEGLLRPSASRTSSRRTCERVVDETGRHPRRQPGAAQPVRHPARRRARSTTSTASRPSRGARSAPAAPPCGRTSGSAASPTASTRRRPRSSCAGTCRWAWSRSPSRPARSTWRRTSASSTSS